MCRKGERADRRDGPLVQRHDGDAKGPISEIPAYSQGVEQGKGGLSRMLGFFTVDVFS